MIDKIEFNDATIVNATFAKQVLDKINELIEASNRQDRILYALIKGNPVQLSDDDLIALGFTI